MKPGFTRGRKRKKGARVDSTGRLDRSETSQVVRIIATVLSQPVVYTHTGRKRGGKGVRWRGGGRKQVLNMSHILAARTPHLTEKRVREIVYKNPSLAGSEYPFKNCRDFLLLIKASAAVVPRRCVGDRGEAAAQKSVGPALEMDHPRFDLPWKTTRQFVK